MGKPEVGQGIAKQSANQQARRDVELFFGVKRMDKRNLIPVSFGNIVCYTGLWKPKYQ